MATYAQAVAAFGISERPGHEIVLVKKVPGKDKDFHEHYTLDEIGGDTVDPAHHWYVAAGRFKPGTVERYKGRRQENLASVPMIGLDFDLKDFLSVPASGVYAMSDGTIASHCERLRRNVEDVLTEAAIPIHGLLYSGHGLLAWIRIADGDVERFPIISDAYHALIKRINELAGFGLCDAQASDAGTRIARLPLSHNVKAGADRHTRVIWDRPGEVTVADLAIIAGVGDRPRQTHLKAVPTPTTGTLGDDVSRLIDLFRPSWQENIRHHFAVAIGGSCAKAGLRQSEAEHIVETLADGVEVEDRLKAVADSYDKHARGIDVRGWYTLREILSANQLVAVEAILETVRKSQEVTLKLGGGKAAVVAQKDPSNPASFVVSPFPESAWYGWFAAYRDAYAPTTEAATQFHLAATLPMVAATIGRSVLLDVGNGLVPNLYSLLLGPSGSSRKDTAIVSAVSMPGIWSSYPRQGQRSIGVLGFSTTRDVTSAEGLIKQLQDSPTLLGYITEVNQLLLNARRKGTATILDTLIAAFDAPPVLENNSKLAASKAQHPALSIVAAGQPGRFAEMISDEDIFSGFANRWIFFPGVGGDPLPILGSVAPEVTVDLYQDLLDAIRPYGSQARIPFDSAALDLNRDWYERIRKGFGRDEGEDSMRQRHQTIAHKIALIYAVTDGSRYVERRHLEAAITLIEWSWENVRRYMQLWGVAPSQRLERRIIDVLTERGPLSRRELQRSCQSRKWTSFEFGRALDALIRNDVLAIAGTLIGIPDEG